MKRSLKTDEDIIDIPVLKNQVYNIPIELIGITTEKIVICMDE